MAAYRRPQKKRNPLQKGVGPAETEKPVETPKKPVVKVEEKKATSKKPEKKAAEPKKKLWTFLQSWKPLKRETVRPTHSI